MRDAEGKLDSSYPAPPEAYCGLFSPHYRTALHHSFYSAVENAKVNSSSFCYCNKFPRDHNLMEREDLLGLPMLEALLCDGPHPLFLGFLVGALGGHHSGSTEKK